MSPKRIKFSIALHSLYTFGGPHEAETRSEYPVSVHPISDLDARSEALVRLLRTVLDEAHQLLGEAPLGEETAALSETILRLQQEAARIAPDFRSENIRFGASGS